MEPAVKVLVIYMHVTLFHKVITLLAKEMKNVIFWQSITSRWWTFCCKLQKSLLGTFHMITTSLLLKIIYLCMESHDYLILLFSIIWIHFHIILNQTYFIWFQSNLIWNQISLYHTILTMYWTKKQYMIHHYINPQLQYIEPKHPCINPK